MVELIRLSVAYVMGKRDSLSLFLDFSFAFVSPTRTCSAPQACFQRRVSALYAAPGMRRIQSTLLQTLNNKQETNRASYVSLRSQSFPAHSPSCSRQSRCSLFKFLPPHNYVGGNSFQGEMHQEMDICFHIFPTYPARWYDKCTGLWASYSLCFLIFFVVLTGYKEIKWGILEGGVIFFVSAIISAGDGFLFHGFSALVEGGICERVRFLFLSFYSAYSFFIIILVGRTHFEKMI